MYVPINLLQKYVFLPNYYKKQTEIQGSNHITQDFYYFCHEISMVEGRLLSRFLYLNPYLNYDGRGKPTAYHRTL